MERQNKKLSDLLNGIEYQSGDVIDAVMVTSLESDSRKVTPGCVFVAIQGYQVDGHAYIGQAIKNGAVAVISQHVFDKSIVPHIRVENTRHALAVMARRFYDCVVDKLAIVGITGTNGKTTVSYMLDAIARAAGCNTGRIGTINYAWNDKVFEASRTTPDILDLHRLFYKMSFDGVNMVIMEISSHALALNRVDGLPVRAAVFTNLSRDHLDFHPDFESYKEAKANLFRMLDPNAVGIVNIDDPVGSFMVEQCTGRSVTIGYTNNSADYQIRNVQEQMDGLSYQLSHQGQEINARSRLWGAFNVYNSAAAIVTALELGIDPDAIQKGLDTLSRVPGRMDGIQTQLGFRVVVDYAHTPDALLNVLKTAKHFTRGKLIVVFGAGGDRDHGKRPEMGDAVSQYGDVVIVTSDNPRTEEPMQIINDIVAGVHPDKNKEIIQDRKKAIYHALDLAGPNDTVIIAGKGHEDYQEIHGQKFPFDDHLIAEEYIKQKESEHLSI